MFNSLNTGSSWGCSISQSGTLVANTLPTTGTIWSSYLMQIGGPGGTSVNSFGVVSGMTTSSGGGTSSGLAGQEAVWRSTSSNWALFSVDGISLRTGPASNLDATNNFFVVNSYNLDSGLMTTYLNPNDLTDVAGSATHTISEAATAGAFTAFTHFGFSLASGEPSTGFIDEVRIGETIGDVTPIAVPEPTSIALLGLCGLGLLTRRRR